MSPSDAPPSAGRYDQEFLYHLYRGSELLQDNSVDEAKAELERALKLQPKDAEGQGLLGIVYFRLGMYPRAIEIYEQLEITAPSEITPKINLALCYLKTGLAERARDKLEQVLERAPEHKRAWGYLGLVFQRFGDFEKARVAFERADRPRVAERMAALVNQANEAALANIPELGPQHGVSSQNLSGPPTSFRPSLMPQVPAPAPTPSLVYPTRPPPPADVTVALPVGRLVREGELVFPEHPRVVLQESGDVLARIDASIALRPACIAALSYDNAPFATLSLRRRSPARSEQEALGGSRDPLVSLIGSGRVILSPAAGTRLFLADAESQDLYLLESALVAFEPEIDYETGRLDPHREEAPVVVRLAGKGTAIGRSKSPIRSFAVSSERPAFVQASAVVGWVGRLLPRMVPAVEAPAGLSSLVGFTGEGAVLLDLCPTDGKATRS